MKTTGIVRRIDGLGRFVIPKEIRKGLSLPQGTPMEYFVEGDAIILRKYEPLICSKCGREHDVQPVLLCEGCQH